MDFDWPLGVAWSGYVNPYSPTTCGTCRGSGVCPDDMEILAVLQQSAKASGSPLEFHEAWGILKSSITSRYFGCQPCGDGGKLWPTPEDKLRYEEWEEVDPPPGAGYQLWYYRTGNWPASPVFEDLRSLAVWCETNATTFASFRASASEWEQMLALDNVHHYDGRIHYY